MAKAEDQLVRTRSFRYVCTYVHMYVSVDSELCIKCALACINCTYILVILRSTTGITCPSSIIYYICRL